MLGLTIFCQQFIVRSNISIQIITLTASFLLSCLHLTIEIWYSRFGVQKTSNYGIH
uniref:Uncharacterized protein n=1 Tax=Arundo donax TaxID=35708 RepID=A0A0A9FV27_ARUDO